MSREKIAIWGAAGHALVVADIIELSGKFQIVGHIDDVDPTRKGESFAGTMILGDQSALGRLRADGVAKIAIAFGDCVSRLRLAAIASDHGFELPTLVHPAAVVARNVMVGAGTVIAAGAVINPGSIIGNMAIVNTGASVDHECIIGDGAHIGPGAHLGGRVSVGTGTWVGIGACVKDKIKIGAGAIVGAGSVVVKEIPDGVVAYGCPARVQRQSTEIGEYEKPEQH